MIWEALGSALLGLAVAYGATRWLPSRFPSRQLALATGAIGALFGGLVAHTALGSGHAVATLIGAAAVGTALLSLLVRPRRTSSRLHRSAA